MNKLEKMIEENQFIPLPFKGFTNTYQGVKLFTEYGERHELDYEQLILLRDWLNEVLEEVA